VPLERVVEFRLASQVDLLPEVIYFIGAAVFEESLEKRLIRVSP
jgi:hypothetical protein